MSLANKYRNSNKPVREGALDYNARMLKERMARQDAETADFKDRQAKVLEAKRANYQALDLEKIAQEGQTTRTGMTEAGSLARTGMTTDLGRETLDQTRQNQTNISNLAEAEQSIGMLDSNRDNQFRLKELGMKQSQFDKEEKLKKKKLALEGYTSIYRSEAGRADPLGTLQGTAGSRALAGYNNFTNQNKPGNESPDMGGATFNQKQIDFLNQTTQPTQSTQPTELAQVGNNSVRKSYTMTQPHTTNRPDNPYYQPPNRPVTNNPREQRLPELIPYENAEVRKRRIADRDLNPTRRF